MAETVKALPEEIKEVLDVRIWNVKRLEGIVRKNELGAVGIPCIAVDEEVVFSSMIPPQEELIEAIMKRLAL